MIVSLPAYVGVMKLHSDRHLFESVIRRNLFETIIFSNKS
jgi:hypothetical protein